jgi:hypothetical protein
MFCLAVCCLAGVGLVYPVPVAAEDWPVKDFEVYFGRPAASNMVLGSAGLGYITGDDAISAFSQVWDPDTELVPPVPMSPANKQKIERYLHEAAIKLETMGFKAPYLEPVVRNAQGRPAFRVYYFDYRAQPPDVDKSSPARRRSDDCERVRPTLQINAGKFLRNGSIPDKGYQDLAHEIFHGVQARYRLFREHCEHGPGAWISEGTAQAIGADVAAWSSLGINHPHRNAGSWPAHRWGLRDYGSSVYIKSKDTDVKSNLAYSASSFWRYLGEHVAMSGGAGTLAVQPNYYYLHQFFDTSMAAPVTFQGSMNWLQGQLTDKDKAVNRSITRVFPEFVTTFAAYGGTRVNPPARTVAQNRTAWLHNMFLKRKCPVISISDAFYKKSEPVTIKALAAECLRLDWKRQEIRDLQVTASGPDKDLLFALTLGTEDGAVVVEPVLIEADNQWRASWLVSIKPGSNILDFIFANVAEVPGETREFNGMIEFSIPHWDRKFEFVGPEQPAPGNGGPGAGNNPGAATGSTGVITKQTQDRRVARSVKESVKSLSPNMVHSTGVDRSPDSAPCPQAFVDIACGPSTTISLDLVPGLYGSGFQSTGRGGVFGQFASMMSGTAAADPQALSKDLEATVAAYDSIDGAKVALTIPLIDYGFSGTFSNASMRVSARGGETFKSMGPNDTQPGPGRRYPLSGRVTIEEYTPWNLRGSFSGALVNVDRLELVGDDPALPVDRSIRGTFQIVAPWRGDDRAVVHMSEDPVQSVLDDMGGLIAGLDHATRDRIREALEKNAAASSSSQGGRLQRFCDCSCNAAKRPLPQCVGQCGATYQACESAQRNALVSAAAAAASNPYLRGLPDACGLLDLSTAAMLLPAAARVQDKPRGAGGGESGCYYADAQNKSGSAALSLYKTDQSPMLKEEMRRKAVALNPASRVEPFDVEGVGNYAFAFVEGSSVSLVVFTGIGVGAADGNAPTSEVINHYWLRDDKQPPADMMKNLYQLSKRHVDDMKAMVE